MVIDMQEARELVESTYSLRADVLRTLLQPMASAAIAFAREYGIVQ